MEESELLFNLLYLLFCMCIIYPSEEFHRNGLTIEQLFANLLGDESINFVRYHQRRTSLNLFVHSCLPSIYFIIQQLKFSTEKDTNTNLDPDFPMPQEAVAFKTLSWKVVQRFSLIIALTVPALIISWCQNNWSRHPISKTIAKYANATQNYNTLVSDINTEVRRNNVYKKILNPISKVIATENWIIKTTLYNVYFAHQDDASVSVSKSEDYNASSNSNETLQIVSILIQPQRAGVSDFDVRINSLDFHNLQDRISRPIVIPADINFHRNVVDRFIDVFKRQVALNPIYTPAEGQIADKCFACMTAEPNIKIHKQCADVDNAGRPLNADSCCTNCQCRPMWCIDCLARWFATRQSEYDREIWLSQKCTCPMCRAKFCLLDVSFIPDSISNTQA